MNLQSEAIRMVSFIYLPVVSNMALPPNKVLMSWVTLRVLDFWDFSQKWTFCDPILNVGPWTWGTGYTFLNRKYQGIPDSKMLESPKLNMKHTAVLTEPQGILWYLSLLCWVNFAKDGLFARGPNWKFKVISFPSRTLRDHVLDSIRRRSSWQIVSKVDQ